MMQVKQCNIKTKCEINGCKNLATITICKENDAKFGLKICENCAKSLNETLSKLYVPKCIPSPFIHNKKGAIR